MSNFSQQFIMDTSGNKVAVIVPIKQFQKMNENLHDLSVVAKRKKDKTIFFEAMKNKIFS